MCVPSGQPGVCRGQDGRADGGQRAETQRRRRGCHGAGGGTHEVCVQGEVKAKQLLLTLAPPSRTRPGLGRNRLFFPPGRCSVQDRCVFCVGAARREDRGGGGAEARRLRGRQLPVDEPRPAGAISRD